MEIRLGSKEDAKIAAELWSEFMDEHDMIIFDQNPWKKEQKARILTSQSLFQKYVEEKIEKDGALILAYEGDDVAGYCLIYIEENLPIYKLKKLGHISDLYVKPKYRGTGVSSKLSAKAEEWFRSQELHYLSISYHPENFRAHEIYKKWGFFDEHIYMWKRLE